MFSHAAPTTNTLLLSRSLDEPISFAATDVRAIAVDNKDYELVSNQVDLQPGQFQIKEGVVYVLPLESVNKRFVLTYDRATPADAKPIDLPKFFQQLGDVKARIELSRSFLGHPKLTFAVIDCLENEQKYRTLANDLEINLFGYKFIVKNLSILREPLDEKLTVGFSVEGNHQSYGSDLNKLDYPIRLADFSDCKNFSTEVTLAQLAKKVGLKYQGVDIKIKVPYNPGEQSVTVRSVLEERANYFGAFPYYSNPNAVEARKWKPKFHVLPEGEKLTKSEFSIGGQNHYLNGTKLSQIYRNAEIILDNGDASIESAYYNKVEVRYEYENCASFGDLQSPAEPYGLGEGGANFYQVPSNEILRNPGNAFDAGGFTKEIAEVHLIRGVEVFRRKWVWGWVFSSLDTYQILQVSGDAVTGSDGNVSAALESILVADSIEGDYKIFFKPSEGIQKYWQQVSYTETDHVFDSEGYKIKSLTTGKRLGRLLQDDNSLKAITAVENYWEYKAAADKLEPGEQKDKLNQQAIASWQLSQAYKFDRTFPETQTTYYQNKPFAQFYDDIIPPLVKDCNWVEPRFNYWKLTVKREVTIEDNPANTEDLTFPPVVTGHIFKEATKTEIYSTVGRGKIKQTNYVSDERGEGLREKFKIQPSRLFSGRPSVHERLSKPKPIDTQSNIKKYKSNKYKKFIINTEGVEQIDYQAGVNAEAGNDYPIVEKPLRFKDIYDIDQALEIADLKLAIANSSSSEIFTRTGDEIPGIDEGDICFDEGIPYLVLGNKLLLTYSDQEFCREQVLQLGKLLEPKNNLQTIKINNLSGSISSKAIAVDGLVSQINNIYNVLSPETARRAAELGLLEDFGEKNGNKVYGIDEITNPETDLIDKFLNQSGETGGGSNSSLGAEGREANPPIDLREKSDVEEFADLINRLSLLDEFDNQLSELIEQGNSASQGSGGGGGAESSSPQFITDFDQPQIILEGGDEFLTNLLEDFMEQLQRILDLLSGGTGVGGAGGGSAGGGGGGAGAGGAAGQEPAFQTGDLTIYIPSPDIDGILFAILEMILEAINLAENFSFDLASLIQSLQETQASGGGGGGNSSGGSGGASGSNITTILTQPEGVEPATIRYIFPPNLTLDDIDLTAIFQALDYLLSLLDEIANREFDFDLDLSLLEPGAALATPVAQQPSLYGVENQSSSGGGSGGSGNNLTITKVAEIKNITGVIGGGISGSTSFPDSWSPSASGSDTSTGEETAVSFGDGSQLNSSNPGEFTFDDGDFNDPGTNYSFQPTPITIVDPVDTGFYYPHSAVEPEPATLVPELSLPEDRTFILNGQSAILEISGATANDLVIWELVGEIAGVEILTPYDLNPSVGFDNTYQGDRVILRCSMRAHDVSATLIINTSAVDSLALSNMAGRNSVINWLGLAVDISTIRPLIQNQGIQTSNIIFTWDKPSNAPIGYYVVNNLGDRSTLITEEQYQFDNSFSYKIIAVYTDLGEIESKTFTPGGGYLLGGDSLQLSDLATRGTEEINLDYSDSGAFYVQETDVNDSDSLELSAMAARGTEEIDLDYSDSGAFYVQETDVNDLDSLELSAMATRGTEEINLDYTDLTPFYSS